MGRLKALIVSCRPAQWVKNTACLAGLIFAGRLGDPHSRWQALGLMGLFCMASSAVYLLNDLLDRDADRASPSKRSRPIASGALPAATAHLAALALALGALAGAWRLHPAVLPHVAGYLLLNVVYSRWLKHLPGLDVLCIAIGFAIRVDASVIAIDAPRSLWMILCMAALALFIGFGKRRAELNEPGGTEARPVLVRYSRAWLDRLVTLSAVLTVVGYTLFAISGKHGDLMLVTVPPVPFVLMRYRRALSASAYSPPEEFLLKDLPCLGAIVLWVAACLYVLAKQG